MSQRLKSLSISNFRAFHSLQIEKLGDVNLIVGKNNVGKTCLLEALWLYAGFGASEIIQQLLDSRSELSDDSDTVIPINRIRYLFHGRTLPAPPSEERIYFDVSQGQLMTLHLAGVNNETVEALKNLPEQMDNKLAQSILHQLSTVHHLDTDTMTELLKVSLTRKPTPATPGRQTMLIVSATDNVGRLIDQDFNNLLSLNVNTIPCQFIPSKGLDAEAVTHLWNSVYLSPFQDDVEQSLQLIEPKIQNVGLVSYGKTSSIPQVRLKGARERVPLGSLGDGMNGLFSLALALVNTQNGLLLVDEVGNGIHYSVQQALWQFIFRTSQRLNIQVFATTHSWDVIEAFQQVAAEHKESDGMLISLRGKQGKPGEVVGTLFNEADLTYVTQEQIEVR